MKRGTSLRFTKLSRAFTLIEVLLAVSISAVVLLSAYQILSTVERAGSLTERNAELEDLTSNLFLVLLKDVESSSFSYGDFKVEDSNGTFSFYTKNCFFTPGVCLVRYYMYENEGWRFLVREERKLNATVNAGYQIPISQRVEGFEVQLFKGSEWSKAVKGSYKPKLLRIILRLEVENGTVEIPFTFKPRA